MQNTINKLLNKLYNDGTMIFLRQDEALKIPGIHLSPQHHADYKGKPKGWRILEDLSGQHDPSSTSLNGSSAYDNDQLRTEKKD